MRFMDLVSLVRFILVSFVDSMGLLNLVMRLVCLVRLGSLGRPMDLVMCFVGSGLSLLCGTMESLLDRLAFLGENLRFLGDFDRCLLYSF